MYSDNKKYFLDLEYNECVNYFKSLDQPGYRSKQLWEGIYKELKTDANTITSLPSNLRQSLDNSFSFSLLNTIKSLKSSYHTNKFLFSLHDTSKIETVLMLYKNNRNTVCISTQVGCGMGCEFCATGQMGFYRNLSSGEIIEQVLFIERYLREQNKNLTNIVVMGMGEPFANYQNTLSALKRLNDQNGFNFGARRITISTVGIIPKIYEFSKEEYQFNLAISLHSANNAVRSRLIPINNKYPLEELIKACKYYINKTNRRLSFEWALIKDINDNYESALELVHLIKGMLSHVNLIVLNPTLGTKLKSSSDNKAVAFKKILEDNGIPSTIRLSRGIDINAGCGQLASKNS